MNFETHIIRRKKWHELQLFVVILGVIIKFTNSQIAHSQKKTSFDTIKVSKEVFTMTDTLFDQLGGTYTQQGDYLLPNLILPAEKETG